jgi:hypothetical protein
MHVTANIQGPGASNYGLGNQLFQIAALLSYAKDHGFQATFPCLQDSQYGGYTQNILRKVNTEPHPVTNAYYREPSFTFSPMPKMNTSFCVVGSYLQSEKYFKNNRDLILDTFSMTQDEESYLRSKYDLDNSPVSIHVRRGDYLDNENYHTNLMRGDYYDKARELFKDRPIIVFSDDPDWAREEFPEYTVAEEVDYLELYLMSLCDNNIIANSSFSWWGAWLNKNPRKKVVAPKNWFGERHAHDTKDLIPSDWILL